MQIVNSIVERDNVPDAIFYRAIGNGQWEVYIYGDTLPTIQIEKPVIIVSAWKIRKALNRLGWRDLAESIITSSNNKDLIDGWNHNDTFESNNPLMLLVAQAAGKTAQDIDELFNLADTL